MASNSTATANTDPANVTSNGPKPLVVADLPEDMQNLRQTLLDSGLDSVDADNLVRKQMRQVILRKREEKRAAREKDQEAVSAALDIIRAAATDAISKYPEMVANSRIVLNFGASGLKSLLYKAKPSKTDSDDSPTDDSGTDESAPAPAPATAAKGKGSKRKR